MTLELQQHTVSRRRFLFASRTKRRVKKMQRTHHYVSELLPLIPCT
uniref:Uncharacterized protein n=1 Tax=Arundo donax TaxID=35708 RepID=A0A0A8Z5P9_ARUDO